MKKSSYKDLRLEDAHSGMTGEEAVRFDAGLMDRELKDYALLSCIALAHNDLEEICYHSAQALHILREDRTLPKGRLTKNSEHMRTLVRYLRLLGAKNGGVPLTEKKVRRYHARVMESLPQVRAILRDTYSDK